MLLVTLSGSGVVGANPAFAAATTITVYAGGGSDDQGDVFTSLLGANHRYTFDGYGTWDPAADRPVPDVTAKAQRMGMKLLRWPGGTVGNTVWWKGTIGSNRMCQRDGRVGPFGGLGDPANPADDVLLARYPSYGLDEHMAFVQAIGAEAQIMVPMTIGNPIDAADLVEYLNTPAGDGVNPNGGTDWAEVRRSNGHAEPYGVTRWELGNEHYHADQRYWMAQDDPTSPTPRRAAIEQYIEGGSRRIVAEGLGKLAQRDSAGNPCAGSTGATPSDGTAGQVFHINYPSAVVDTFTLRVNGVTWRQVASLSTAGPLDHVYVLRPHIGEVAFGDGVHGAIPPAGATVVADYTSVHLGFVDFYARMKAVDPDIHVCASWGAVNFPSWFKQLAPAGSRYDCLTVHPYTHFEGQQRNDWDSAVEAHDWHILSSWDQREFVLDVREAVNANTSAPHPFVAISEYGALWGPNQPFKNYASSMTHALYMADQWINWLDLGIPWAEGNDFSSDGWYTLLGPAGKGFVFSAEAAVREAVRPMFEARGRRIRYTVSGNPLRDPSDAELCDYPTPPLARCADSYAKLKVTATRGPAGAVYVMVVNRSPAAGDAITADIVVNGFTGNGTAEVRQVAPASFTAYNDDAGPTSVTMAASTRSVGANRFTATFPPHSVALFRLPPA